MARRGPRLVEAEYQVVLFDHVDFGGSDLSQYHFSTYGTLQRFANDRLEICDELQLENSTASAGAISTNCSNFTKVVTLAGLRRRHR
jgi:pimeloyl-ACP methyl ester carboxylesterase